MATNVDSLAEELESQTLNDVSVIEFRGAGKKLDKKEDIDPICQALEQKPDVTMFCLQGNTLGSEAAKYLGDSLSKCLKLERLLCEDIFTGRMKSDIPLSLRCLSKGLMASGCRLAELDFSGNAFGELAINAMYELLTSPTCYSLKTLRLHNTGLGPSGGVRLAQALSECLEKSNGEFRLERFMCGRSRLENEGAKALAKFFAKSPELVEVCIPQDGIFKEGIAAIGDALTNCPKLRRLNINDNIVSPQGAEEFKHFLKQFKKLEGLNIGDCVLKSEGAHHIAEGIRDLTTLISLNLDHNEIEIQAGLEIVETMSNKPNLCHLDLDGNCFGAEGIARLEQRMDELGLIEALCVFSEDEKDEDEDEHSDKDAFTFEDFAMNPTLESLLQLENPRAQSQEYLDTFQCLDHAGLLRMFVKIGSACDGSPAAVDKATECSVPVLQQIASLDSDPHELVNQFAIYFGFVKDETRTVKTPKDLSGLLLITANFKSTLPEQVTSALKTFVLNMAANKCSKEYLGKVMKIYEEF